MELIYTLPKEDCERLSRTMAKPKIKQSLLDVIIMGCVMSLLLSIVFNSILVMGLALSVVALYAGFSLLMWNKSLSRHIEKYIEKVGQPFFDYERSITLNDGEIINKTHIGEAKIIYDAVKQIKSDSQFIEIELDEMGGKIYIPISGIKNPGIKDDFISLLKLKTNQNQLVSNLA